MSSIRFPAVCSALVPAVRLTQTGLAMILMAASPQIAIERLAFGSG
jgi:hypothetical protein